MKRIAACTGLALVVLTFAAPALGAEGASMGIRPTKNQDWFRFSASPGETVTDVAAVINKTAEPVTVFVYAVDALVTPQGSFALRERTEARTGVGAWANVQPAQLTLAPRSVTRVPFRLTVPQNAEPGDYAGGIVVERASRDGDTADLGKGVAFRLSIVERVGVRTFLRVDGAVVRRLEVGRIGLRRVPGGVEASVNVRNTGTVRLSPSGSLRMSGWRVPEATLPMSAPEVVLPGSTATLKAIWRDVPAAGRVRFDATVTSEAGPVGAGGASMTLVPWRLMGIAAAALAALGLLVRRLLGFTRRVRRALRVVPWEGSAGTPEAPMLPAWPEPEGSWSGMDVAEAGAEAVWAEPGLPSGLDAAAQDAPAAGVSVDEEGRRWLELLFRDPDARAS